MITISVKEFKKNTKNQGPLISLDIGTARIGIATSDFERIIANPSDTYVRRNISKDLGHLGKVASDKKAIGIVVGLPLQLDGSEGENCKLIRNFADKLFKKTNLPILLKDERMSTAAATRALSESGMTRKKRQSLDDKTAASIILNDILDMLKS